MDEQDVRGRSKHLNAAVVSFGNIDVSAVVDRDSNWATELAGT